MSRLLVYLLGLIAVLGLNACTKERIIERQAPAEIQQAFAISGNSLQIKKTSLNKVFLLMTSGKTGGAVPQWVDIKPQVVSFEKDAGGKKLALIEENYDSVYDEIQTGNLLATFDIVREDGENITFEWGKGLQSIVYVDAFDVDTPNPEAAAQDSEDASKAAMPVIDSYVKSLNFDQANNLEINQVSRVRVPKISTNGEGSAAKLETREETLALNLQIRPYVAASKEFFSKEADTSRRVGFFVTKLKKKAYSNGGRNLITKWDMSADRGPVTFLISSATPPQYVQAAVEGVLYWNKVFGREVIVVKTGVDPQTAPQNRSVMVHWIPWLDSGAAYAQNQSDPLTGEVLRGQIFMPSAFTRISSTNLLLTNGGQPTRKPVLNNTTGCEVDRRVLGAQMMALEASDSERLRLAQDSVRSTVAHEAGHTLGLRHNFAASISTPHSDEEIYTSAKTYLKDLQHPGLETATSMMDYVGGVDDILSSAYIKHDALSYDKMAMQWAYAKEDAKILDEAISKYCSDEDIDFAAQKKKQVYGCERFDGGRNVLARKILETRQSKDNLIAVMYMTMLSRLYPVDTEAMSVDAALKSLLPVWKVLSQDPAKYIGSLLLKKEEFISLDNAKENLAANYDSEDPTLDAQIQKDLQASGGYVSVVNQILRDAQGAIDLTWIQKQTQNLVNSPKFKQGQTLSGQNYALTADQETQILALFTEMQKLNEKTLFAATSLLLPTDKVSLRAGVLQTTDVPALAQLVLDVQRASLKLQDIKAGAGQAITLQVPEKYLSLQERQAYLKLLSNEAVGGTDVQAAKQAVVDGLRKDIDAVLLTAADSVVAPPDGTLQGYRDYIANLEQNQRLDAAGLVWVRQELEVLTPLFVANENRQVLQ